MQTTPYSVHEVFRFDAGHDDLIHDIAYDFYGKRVITCSSDQKIKVWDRDPETDKWILNDAWKAHDSSVVKVTWAHPEFGNVFASCSCDRTVKIWEEQEHEPLGGGRRWKLRATLSESKGSVQDIEMAPNHLGFKLATCSADGFVRIYEAIDVVNVGSWTLMSEIEVVPGCKETERLCLSWCPSRFQPQMIVVGCGRENVARIYKVDANNQWQGVQTLSHHQDMITDVAWAPNMGRSYQLIATACKDGRVRIFKLLEESKSAWDGSRSGTDYQSGGFVSGMAGAGQGAGSRFRVNLVADLGDHQAEVWRVEWNVLGTILSSSGDDGKVRLWKSTFLEDWKCRGVIAAEGTPESMEQ
ncbi:epoxide hydrolase, soluble (sEH) [Blyttiomyces sp. JEL0837]|nr:epoxide hydrolase, soluble (sEH) [Blyttiomyces sp. JEL0837]